MPRRYRCKKCGVEHAPPTGKHCRNEVHTAEQDEEPKDDIAQVLHAIKDLKTQVGSQMAAMETRMSRVELRGSDTDGIEIQEGDAVDSDEQESESEQSVGEEQMNPQMLRKDFKLMARAAQRLAELGREDLDEEDQSRWPRQRDRGKKSGSTLVASDLVRDRIDWPHMHVKRVTNGRRKNVEYTDMKVEEFVFGFIKMIRAPRNKMDSETMIDILLMLMQDTIDFSWKNALNFYEMLGLDVENGDVAWSDNAAITSMRMTYSRTVFPDKKEAKEGKETSRPQPRAAPAGMRCCAPYQTRSCENTRDHHPFTHACSYCHRKSAILARHAEDDCFKKIASEPKNVQKREPNSSLT